MMLPIFIRNAAAAFLILASHATTERVGSASMLADIDLHSAGFKSSKRHAGDVVLSVDISHAASCGMFVKDNRIIKVRITDWDRTTTIDRELVAENIGRTGHKNFQEVLSGFGAEVRGDPRNLLVEVRVEQEGRFFLSSASCGSTSFNSVSLKWDDSEVLLADPSEYFPQFLSITLAPKPQPFVQQVEDISQGKEHVPLEDPCQKCTEVEEALCTATAGAQTDATVGAQVVALRVIKNDICQSVGNECASCQHVECRGTQIGCDDDVWDGKKGFLRDFVTKALAKQSELKAKKAEAEARAAALTENKLKEDAETAEAICKATPADHGGCRKVSNSVNSRFPAGYQCVSMAFKKSKFTHSTCAAPAWWEKIKTNGPFDAGCAEDSYSLCSPDLDGEDCKNGGELFTIQKFNKLGCIAKPTAA